MSGTDDDAEVAAALDEALAHVEGLAKEGAAPDRYDARWLLLTLGEALARGSDEALAGALARARAARARLGEPFERALAEELALAAAEHVHAVDPRYLSHPRYDFDYTDAARERLEWRLGAADRLGIGLAPALQRSVDEADRLLAERRPGPGPA